MSTLKFRIMVARTNPMIVRIVEMPGEFGAEELFFTCLTALGHSYDPESMEYRLCGEDGRVMEEGQLKQLFSECDRATLSIIKSINTKASVELSVFVDFLGIEEKKDISLPEVTFSEGFNLPRDVWDTKEINQILISLLDSDSVSVGNGLFFTRRELTFSGNKCDNALRRRFAPKTAKRELNYSIGLPMKQLISSINVSTLRSIAGAYGIYLYSATKKVEIVSRICTKYSRSYIKKIFDDAGVGEFMAFRDFVLDESAGRYDESVEESLYFLYDRGLITPIKGRGYVIASEVLDYYDEFYGTEAEETFVKEKNMRSAMSICASLYGLFDFRMFCAILEVLKTLGISDEEKRDYYNRVGRGDLIGNLSRTGNDMLLAKSKVNPLVTDRLLLRVSCDDDFYLPDEQEALLIEKNGICFSDAAQKRINEMLREYSGYYYYESPIDGAGMLHYGKTVKEVFNFYEKRMYGLGWRGKMVRQEVTQELTKLLEGELKSIPLVELRGYSMDNCPADIKEKFGKAAASAVTKKRVTATKKTAAKPVKRKR